MSQVTPTARVAHWAGVGSSSWLSRATARSHTVVDTFATHTGWKIASIAPGVVRALQQSIAQASECSEESRVGFHTAWCVQDEQHSCKNYQWKERWFAHLVCSLVREISNCYRSWWVGEMIVLTVCCFWWSLYISFESTSAQIYAMTTISHRTSVGCTWVTSWFRTLTHAHTHTHTRTHTHTQVTADDADILNVGSVCKVSVIL